MKKIIQKWLGVDDIKLTLNSHTSSFQSLNKTLEIDKLKNQIEELQQEHIWVVGICNGLLDYFDIDYKVERVPDLRFMPEQPRLRDEIRIKSKKKSSSTNK